MRCRDVSDFLAGDEAAFAGATEVESHIATCESCGAQKEQFAELSTALSALSEESLEPPGWLLATVSEAVLEKAAQREAMRKLEKQIADPKFITTGALVAAGIAGALLMRGRRRRRTVRTRVRQALTAA
ncbi:MAG: hypothetical protein ACRDIA_04780 [Actinomycetota bacterium]